ncbi:uncharacterized protein CC84DRAFT_490830 [Paraphaeosphaeria sporulosa]|uniref:Uncharacterized protein n=1 Tax=Paraphaeosphaeria sporulosa TaxID=1460663 RepID=A0A177CSV4_9PLEO|nr:uncharacterized protein CC84DRAFT_490830 [Paraphaeosphaeria sporulosa]OAG10615.1 hypothetical protein CC84DRAFT_490830 [Paraphaeosphaeria sporulosa]
MKGRKGTVQVARVSIVRKGHACIGSCEACRIFTLSCVAALISQYIHTSKGCSTEDRKVYKMSWVSLLVPAPGRRSRGTRTVCRMDKVAWKRRWDRVAWNSRVEGPGNVAGKCRTGQQCRVGGVSIAMDGCRMGIVRHGRKIVMGIIGENRVGRVGRQTSPVMLAR